MKVSIVGIGHVGSALAFVLTLKNIVKELVLVGRTRESAKGDVLDLRHGQLFVDTPAQVTAGTLVDTAGSDIIAMCASIPTPKDMRSRLELARGNVELMRQLMPELARLSPGCKVVMVSNPVDVLVHYALEFTGFRPHQVIGTGTLVDSARFRQLLAEELRIHSGDIRAYILGEHGRQPVPGHELRRAPVASRWTRPRAATGCSKRPPRPVSRCSSTRGAPTTRWPWRRRRSSNASSPTPSTPCR